MALPGSRGAGRPDRRRRDAAVHRGAGRLHGRHRGARRAVEQSGRRPRESGFSGRVKRVVETGGSKEERWEVLWANEEVGGGG